MKGPGVVTGRSGLLGSVFYVTEDFWPLNTALYIRSYNAATPLFSYFLLRTLDLGSYNAGSSVPTLNGNHVHDEAATIPPRALLLEFEGIAERNFGKIAHNYRQIRTLAALRDTLLPKLMSGEVQVNNV